MKKLHQKGFTLVELAIVLTIIGLLIGGILKGQQLMTNARVTATLAQINAVEAATTTFRDTYSAMPGDMTTAATRLNNCANCGLAVAATAGDGVIGPIAWNLATFNSASYAGGAAAGTVNNETVLFWVELAHAGLISGIRDDGINNVAASCGGSLLAARIAGCFVVGNASGVLAPPGRPAAPVSTMTGTVLGLFSSPAVPVATTGTQPATSAVAAQMDRKMDDGSPAFGNIQAYGFAANCFSTVAPFTAANPGYLETAGTKDCGLYFQIQG
jgi:prepilin-type N-terminal cleavage/methylation domain-containing protein